MLKDTAKEDAALDITDCDIKPAPIDLAKINTLHELLALALDDFEKVLQDPSYGIDVGGTFHSPASDRSEWSGRAYGRCTVCVAGAVMAKSLDAPYGEEVSPSEFGAAIERRLQAVNCLRSGFFSSAHDLLRFGRVRYLDSVAPAVVEMESRWTAELVLNDAVGARLCDAHKKRDGRRLLSKLRIMQRELQEAGL